MIKPEFTNSDFACPPPRRISPAERAQPLDYRPPWYQAAQTKVVRDDNVNPHGDMEMLGGAFLVLIVVCAAVGGFLAWVFTS